MCNIIFFSKNIKFKYKAIIFFRLKYSKFKDKTLHLPLNVHVQSLLEFSVTFIS